MKALLHPDGSHKCIRTEERPDRAYHYLGSEFPQVTLCGLAAPFGTITADRFSNGLPLPICRRCQRKAAA